MKYCNWTIISLILLIFSNDVSARWTYWPSYTYSPSYYQYRQPSTNVFIKDCSSKDFVLHIKEIEISPSIITPGGELTIKASGTLDEPVLPGALADVTVKLGAVKLLHKVFDLCDELDKKKEDVEIQCPIKDGDLTVTQKVTLPKEVPKAKFGVLVHASTADGNHLACLEVTVDFRVHPRNRLLQLSEEYNRWD